MTRAAKGGVDRRDILTLGGTALAATAMSQPSGAAPSSAGRLR